MPESPNDAQSPRDPIFANGPDLPPELKQLLDLLNSIGSPKKTQVIKCPDLPHCKAIAHAFASANGQMTPEDKDLIRKTFEDHKLAITIPGEVPDGNDAKGMTPEELQIGLAPLLQSLMHTGPHFEPSIFFFIGCGPGPASDDTYISLLRFLKRGDPSMVHRFFSIACRFCATAQALAAAFTPVDTSHNNSQSDSDIQATLALMASIGDALTEDDGPNSIPISDHPSSPPEDPKDPPQDIPS